MKNSKTRLSLQEIDCQKPNQKKKKKPHQTKETPKHSILHANRSHKHISSASTLNVLS